MGIHLVRHSVLVWYGRWKEFISTHSKLNPSMLPLLQACISYLPSHIFRISAMCVSLYVLCMTYFLYRYL